MKRSKYALFCSALSGLLFLSNGCSAPESRFQNAIVASPAAVELSRVAEGAKKTATVQLINREKTRVEISGVSTSCGCTTSQVKSKVLEPGQSVALDIAYDSTGFLGLEEKFVSVSFTDGRDDLEIPVRADVYSLLEISPPRVDFGKTKLGQSKTAKVEIKRKDGGFLPLSRFNSVQDVDYKIVRKSNSHVVLTFVLNAKNYAGLRNEIIHLQTGLEALPQINIPVESSVASRYQVTPAQINFGVVSTVSERKVVISPLVKGQLPQMTIAKVPAGFSATLSKAENSYVLTVRNDASHEQKIINENVILHVDSRDESLI